VILPIIAVAFGLFYVTSLFVEPKVDKKITIAAGSKGGTYYKMASLYKEQLEKEGVSVEVLTTTGSVENAVLIKKKKADVGFVQSGILSHNEEGIVSLASLYYEPLWVFYHNEGFNIDYIIHLIGKKISIGEQGSGTKHLSTQILADNGINENNTQIHYLNTKESKERLLSGELDAILLVSSASSSVIYELLSDPKISILSFKRAQAYGRKYNFLRDLILFEGTIDLYKNIPDEDKKLLLATANLISRADLADDLVRLLLKKIKPIHSQKGIFEKEFEFPNMENLDTPLHPEAQRYLTNGDSWLEKIFPFWIASNIDRLKILIIPLLTLLFPIIKGIVPLYVWTMRSKIYRWYKKINEIDLYCLDNPNADIKSKLQELHILRDEIQKQTNVPLSYMGEYYNLLLHIDMIEKKIKK
jgi:TRAP transporter TAXI family solute receptor